MSHEIHKAGIRAALEPRREPYWGAPLSTGRYLGVRKLANGACIWIARLRDDDGRQRYRSLGQAAPAFDYSQAKDAAESWFENFDAGIIDKPLTVSEACREYVTSLKAEGRLTAAHDAEVVFKRLIDPQPIGRVLVEKLKTSRIKEWRDGLGGAPSSQNRHLNILRAALNLAVAHSRVSATAAQQWKAVKIHKDAGRRRTLYLDLKQRRRLLKACKGPFRDLVEAAMLTGARPGELAELKRAQFDDRTGTATFKGKTGERAVPLSPAAAALFKRLAKDKLPEAYLLVQEDGREWKRWDWDELMRDAASKAKLPSGVVMYTLRHSFITEALAGGLSTLDVARLTGTSLPMIEKHYGHLVASSARERLAKVELL